MNKQLVPIKEEKNFMRETNSMAIVNVDYRGLEAYRKRRDRERKIENMESELHGLKKNMEEIKGLLKNIVTNGG